VRFVNDESGATAIEYGLIAALIAVGIIAAARGFGSQISTTFNFGHGRNEGVLRASEHSHGSKGQPRSRCGLLFTFGQRQKKRLEPRLHTCPWPQPAGGGVLDGRSS
jgi:pilus assembly protein Flp/PilA